MLQEGRTDRGELSTAGSPAIPRRFPRTGGFATPPCGRFAFVSVRPESRGSLIRVGPTPSGRPALYSSSRSHRRSVRREPSIDTHTIETSAGLSHIADITRRPRVAPAMNSSPFKDVQAKSRQRHSDLCHMCWVRQARENYSRCSARDAACVACLKFQARSLPTTTALNDQKKRGRISCPSRNDHRGPLRLLLSDSNYFRTICCTPIRTAVMSFRTAGKRAFARNPSRRWCFGSPTFVPLLREIRGFAALPRDRCAFSCSQSSGREHFYTGTNLNWCGLNLIIT